MKQRRRSTKSKISGGKVAEYKLAAELLAKGVVPYWPSAHDEPYDVVVEFKKQALKIQVKGTEAKGGSVAVSVKTRRGKYTTKDADVISIYLFEYDVWYFLPTSISIPSTLRIRPNDPACKYWKYRNAWGRVIDDAT